MPEVDTTLELASSQNPNEKSTVRIMTMEDFKVENTNADEAFTVAQILK